MSTPSSAGRAADDVRGHALEDDLGWALGVVFRSYVKAVDSVLNDIPGGPRGHQVLTAAVQQRNANQGELAARLGIDRTVLTYLIDDLEEVGLVERRPDPTDRRSRLVVATAEGAAVWRERQDALRHVELRVLDALGADAESFRTLLRRLAVEVDRADPVVDACSVVTDLRRLDEVPPASRRPRGADRVS